MSQNISAVIITFNEEANIERCLESVIKVVDEIVVVDSFSTDQTEAICKRYDVRFIKRKWTDYADQKNYANSCVESDFILSLDADEALSEMLSDSILNQVKLSKGCAFNMNRLSRYSGRWIRHSGWYPDRKVRLFHRSDAIWVGPVPHERLELSKGVDVRFLAGDLLHFPFKSAKEHKLKALQYSKLAANSLQTRPVFYLISKLIFSPSFRFLKTFILQRGYLDGLTGFKICIISSWEVLMKYSLAILKKYGQ